MLAAGLLVEVKGPARADTRRMSKPRYVRAFSAGGVLFRRTRSLDGDELARPSATPTDEEHPEITQVALVGSSAERFWVLPKGTPLEGEPSDQAAIREVAEETGVRGRIVEEIGSIQYWFSRRGVRYNKEVLYYLMVAESGDVSLHDHEYAEARWFAFEEAKRLLTYPNEAALLAKSEPGISKYLTGEAR